MANDTVNRQINIYIQSGDAQKAFDILTAKEKVLKEQLEAATDPKIISRLNAELAKLVEPIDKATRKLSGELKPSIRDLEGTAVSLRRQIKSFDGSEADFQKLKLQLQAVKLDLSEAKVKAESLQLSLKDKAGGIAQSFFSGFGVGAGIELVSVAGAAVKQFFSGAIDEALEAQRQSNALKQTLQTFGGIDAFDRLSEKANKFANTFTFIDNDDFVGVFNKLITYGKLTEQQMDQLIPTITDYYSKQKLAGDINITMADATDTVIKALEGNVKGLKTYGISMGDAKTTTERFNVVMDQLGPKVAGAGQAFSQDLSGQLQTADQEIKNLQEDIGTYLIPIWSNVKIAFLSAFKGIIDGLAVAYNAVIDTAKGIAYFFASDTQKALDRNRNALNTMNDDAKQFADKQVEAFSSKPLKEQEANLKANLALLQASKATYDQLRQQGKDETAAGAAARLAYKQDLLIVEGLQKSIGARKSGKTLGINEDVTEQKEKERLAKIEAARIKKEQADAAKDAREQQAHDDLYAGFVEKLEDFNTRIDGINLSQVDKEINGNALKYSQLQNQYVKALNDKKITQEEFNHLSLMADELESRERGAIIQKWAKDLQAKQEKVNADASKAGTALDIKRLKQASDAQMRIAQEIARFAVDTKAEMKASLELQILKKHGDEKLAATLALLKLEEQMEIAAAEGKEKKIALIEEQYRLKARAAQITSIQTTLKKIGDYANAVLPALEAFFKAQDDKDQASIASSKAEGETKKKTYQNQLNGKLLSQAEYQKKLDAIDKEQEKKELDAKIKAFNREKIFNLAKALIQLPSAVLQGLSEGGPVLAAIVAAAGLLQIALIAKAKPPTFGLGGRLPGPSHADGGMPILNPVTGNTVATVEGGEVILSKRTAANNPNLIEALLHSSMFNGGASIQAAWQNQRPVHMDLVGIGRSLATVRRFEKGGVLPGSPNDSKTVEPAGFNEDQFKVLISVLREDRKAKVVVSEFNDQSERLQAIKDAATAKK